MVEEYAPNNLLKELLVSPMNRFRKLQKELLIIKKYFINKNIGYAYLFMGKY